MKVLVLVLCLAAVQATPRVKRGIPPIKSLNPAVLKALLTEYATSNGNLAAGKSMSQIMQETTTVGFMDEHLSYSRLVTVRKVRAVGAGDANGRDYRNLGGAGHKNSNNDRGGSREDD